MSNLFWGNHLNYFCIKFRSMDAQVLSRSFHTKIIQSTTAITSIVVAFSHESKKINYESIQKFLLLFAFAKSRISLFFRHCEANLRFAEAIQTKIKSARSANQFKSFCYFLLSQKVESLLSLNFNLPNKANSINPTQQTIEGIAVEVVKFLANLGRETRLGVCERPKFAKSTQDAPKSKLQKEIAYDS